MSSDGDMGEGRDDGQEPRIAGTATLPGHQAAAGRKDGTGGGEPGEPDCESRRWEREERAAGESMASGTSMAGSARLLAQAVVTTLAGMGLRLHLAHPLVAAAVVAAVLAVIGASGPAALRMQASQEPQEPEWVQDLTAYRAWLPHRVPAIPAQTLAAADRYLAAMSGRRWRSAHLFIARSPAGKRISSGLTSPRGNRVEVILADHVALGAAQVAEAVLAHEARHLTGWRPAIFSLATTMRARGLFIVGWAVPWPAVIPAAILLHVACTLAIWVVEVSCDLGAAGQAGRAAMMDYFGFARSRNHVRPGLKRIAAQVLHWAAGPGHPPIAVRRAIIRTRYWRMRPCG